MAKCPVRKLKSTALYLKQQIRVLYLSCRDPRTPWYAKLFAAIVTAYAFSPVDLIPDFVPVLGYVDDLILIPLGIVLALRMIPNQVLADNRHRAQAAARQAKPTSWAAGFIIIGIWVAIAVWVAVQICRYCRYGLT